MPLTMAMKPSVIVLFEHENLRAIVRPIGEIDVADAGDIEERIQRSIGAGYIDVVLDLQQVTFMDSALVGVISRNASFARRDGHEFSVIPGGPGVRRLLDLSGVSALVTVRWPADE